MYRAPPRPMPRHGGSYGEAASKAQSLIATGSVNVVAVAIGGDVAVYADTADNNGAADDLGRPDRPHPRRHQRRERRPGDAARHPAGPPRRRSRRAATPSRARPTPTRWMRRRQRHHRRRRRRRHDHHRRRRDVIVIGQGQSLPAFGQTDVVTDWSSSDSIRFGPRPRAPPRPMPRPRRQANGEAVSQGPSLIATGSVNDRGRGHRQRCRGLRRHCRQQRLGRRRRRPDRPHPRRHQRRERRPHRRRDHPAHAPRSSCRSRGSDRAQARHGV